MSNLERPLRGFEKLFALPNHRCKIAHIYSLCGNIQHIIDSALDAIVYLHERHPMLRAELVFVEGSQEILVRCRETPLPKDQLAPTFKVVLDCKPLFWQEYLATECNKYLEPLSSPVPSSFEFHVLRAEGDLQGAHLIIFSEHCFSDGFSGFRLAYDFLSFIFEKKKFPNMPLPSCTLDLMTSHSQFIKGCLRLIKPVLQKRTSGVCTNFPIPDYIPEPKEDHFIQYPKYFSFREISVENYMNITKTCKTKGITMMGPLLATMLAALSRVGKKPTEAQPYFDRFVDFDINTRKRCQPSLGNDSVGNLVATGSFGSILTGKLTTSLHSNFWKLSNQLMKDVHSIANNNLSCIQYSIYFDIIGSSEKVFLNNVIKSKKLIIGDVNFSNLGVFPFPSTYIQENSDTQRVEIDSVSFCNNLPAVGNAVVLFVCSQKTLTFAMNHRTEAVVADTFFAEWIKLMEEVPSIQNDDTLGQLISRVIG